MKVVQLVPGLSSKDAVGNEVLNLDRILRNAGYEAYIFTPWIKGLDGRENICLDFEELELGKNDIILYHFAIGSYLTDYFMRTSSRKVLWYHNVTPRAFFDPYDSSIALGCERGLRQAELLAAHVDHCIADSEFNKQELISKGYDSRIDVVPIALDPQEYEGKLDESLCASLKRSTGTRILFVGRIVPNKRFEDIIKAFYIYKVRYDQHACLNLVGSFDPEDKYYQALIKYVDDLGVSRITFTGSVSFPQLNAYYKGSDILLCQSEHEGFCVPLVEAMMHDLPVIGYDYCAVGETMGDGTLALPTKDPEVVAGIMNRIQSDQSLKASVLSAQRHQVQRFTPAVVEGRFLDVFRRIVNNS